MELDGVCRVADEQPTSQAVGVEEDEEMEQDRQSNVADEQPIDSNSNSNSDDIEERQIVE